MYSEKRNFGNLGEDLAVRKLESLGMQILERNHLRKWGEIDIVARGTDGKVHFIEVKTAKRNLDQKTDVSRDTYMPEENVTREKLMKLERVVKTWISEKTHLGEWQIDVMAVEIDIEKRIGKCRFLENVY